MEFIKLSREQESQLTKEEYQLYLTMYKQYIESLPFNIENVEKQEKLFESVMKTGSYLFEKMYCPIVEGQENIPNDNGMIIVANHNGSWDQFPIIYALGNRPMHFLMASSLFTWQEFYRGYLFLPFGPVPVNRKSPESRNEAQETMMQYVAHGRNAAYFPQGSRYKSLDEPFEGFGAVRNAQVMGAPILPVVINDDYKILKNKHIFCQIREPFYVDSSDDLAEVNEEMRHQLLEGVEDIKSKGASFVFKQKHFRGKDIEFKK